MQNAFNTHGLFIDSKEDYVGSVRAGPQSWPKVRPLGTSERCENDLLSVLE